MAVVKKQAAPALPCDRVRPCAACGITFVWTIYEQQRDPAPPDLCPMCRRLAPPAGRQRGLVKWFSRARGYGFITPADGPEVFLHRSGLAQGQPLPRAGQLVEFTLSRGARGIQAEDTVILELPPAQP